MLQMVYNNWRYGEKAEKIMAKMLAVKIRV